MFWLFLSCLTPQKKQQEISFSHPLDSIPIPEVMATQPYTPPIPSSHQLEYGATLMFTPNNKLPLINLSIVLPGGFLDDEKKWGRAEIIASMLLKSTEKNDMQEQSALLRAQGAQIDVSVREQNTIIEIMVHKDQLASTLPLISDMIFAPLFSEEEWDSLIEYRSTEIAQSYEDAKKLSYSLQNLILYPEDHPYHRLSKGSPSSVQSLQRKDAQEWHMKRLNPKNVGILAVGDIQTEELISVLNTQLNRWPKTNWNPQKISWEGALNTGVFLIDLPEEQQSNLRVLVPAWTELPTLKVLEARSLGIAMGGSFTSRLNNKLREEKGYTYGAYCSFQQKKTGTIFQASTSVRRDATAPALNEFLDTLNSSKQGFSQEEWGKSKSTMRNNIISQYESRQGTLSSMEELWLFERDNSFFQNQLHTLRQFGVESPTEFSHLFSSNRGIVIITGDSATIKEELAPWNPIDIDMNALLK